jgi:hypothetical protein
MSTKIENVVYRASERDEISANIESVSFSTATGDYTNHARRGLGWRKVTRGSMSEMAMLRQPLAAMTAIPSAFIDLILART